MEGGVALYANAGGAVPGGVSSSRKRLEDEGVLEDAGKYRNPAQAFISLHLLGI